MALLVVAACAPDAADSVYFYAHETPLLSGRQVRFCAAIDSVRPNTYEYQGRALRLDDCLEVSLADVWPNVDALGDPGFGCGLQDSDVERFEAWTTEMAGKEIAIVVDDRVVFAVTISAPVETGLFLMGGGNLRQASVDAIVSELRGDDAVADIRASGDFHVSGPDEWGGRSEGLLRGGVREGTWQQWRPDGQKWREGPYEAGNKHGTWRFWGEDGSLQLEIEFEHGEQQPLDG